MSWRSLLLGSKDSRTAGQGSSADDGFGRVSGQHEVQRLSLMDLPASVNIEVWDQSYVAYEGVGSLELLDLISFNVNGSTLSAEGPASHALIHVNDSGTIVAGGYTYRFGPSNPAPVITFKVPAGTELRIFDTMFDVKIADTLAPLTLRVSGASRVAIGRIADLDARLSGSSEAKVAFVSRSASLRLSGSSEIVVADGEMDVLFVKTSGSSRAIICGTAGEGTFEASGSSSIKEPRVAAVRGRSTSGFSTIKYYSVD